MHNLIENRCFTALARAIEAAAAHLGAALHSVPQYGLLGKGAKALVNGRDAFRLKAPAFGRSMSVGATTT